MPSVIMHDHRSTVSLPRLAWACALMVCGLMAGCRGPWSASQQSEPLGISHSPVAVDGLARKTASATPSPASVQAAAYHSADTPAADVECEAALENLVVELRQSMELSPPAERELTRQLRAANREQWPLVVQQFRSALAFQRQLLARESEKEPRRSASRHHVMSTERTAIPESRTAEQPPSSQPAMASADSAENTSPVATPVASNESGLTGPAADHAPLPASTNHSSDALLDEMQVAIAKDRSDSGTNAVANVSADVTGGFKTTSYSSVAESTETHEAIGWAEHLNRAVAALEESTNPKPGNTAELHEHVRLRLLCLLAGQEAEAFEAIPGASAAEQDYWSKQLFAISTLLNDVQQPEFKERAAGSLMHLDQARAKLSELASLRIRNMTFVTSLNGYGIYEPCTEVKFKPGEQVTIYAEVENFRSEATAEGFRTSLGTSYEVVDPSGRRVDGAQFPQVEDVCKSRRHDFHMQYGVALPTRIYPGQYELRLTITDQASNKIGQSSIPFEIVE